MSNQEEIERLEDKQKSTGDNQTPAQKQKVAKGVQMSKDGGEEMNSFLLDQMKEKRKKAADGMRRFRSNQTSTKKEEERKTAAASVRQAFLSSYGRNRLNRPSAWRPSKG